MQKRTYTTRILLVEDDQGLADLLIRFLSDEYTIIHTLLPSEALEQIALDDVNIILLDLSLPQMDGLELCKKLKKISKAKIIISSARNLIKDKLTAFDYGAQDYLSKPYDPRELKARIELQLKKETNLTTITKTYIEQKSLKVFYKDMHVTLSTAEFEIFSQLFRHEGQILSREQLANATQAHDFDSSLDSISVLIGRIRKKLLPLYDNYNCIRTIRLAGYTYESI
ncbi:response regulator transcription factor [Sulfurimonas sp. SAG-AH-194-L11]|nr:response regulator transcription factor [Sulfurimonas sp. SAG-AH-194-L11]MDF1876511.1 response regulator transcription factor [Sulfurimonas sp. SAG-AH-194-L11]